MQTKPTLDLSTIVARQSTEAEPVQVHPIELDLTVLQSVGGGLPRGGWSADALVVDTTDLPRGGW
jgi:hypothetical protein